LTNIHVSLATWNVTTKFRIISIDFLLPIALQAGWALENTAPWLPDSKEGWYQSHRIFVIQGYMSVQCLIPLSFSVSHESGNAYLTCIQLIMATDFYPQYTLLHPLPDLWLVRIVMSLPYINHAFCFNNDPVTLSWGTSTRASTNEWHITAEHGYSCLCNECKCWVIESRCLDDGKQIGSKLNRT